MAVLHYQHSAKRLETTSDFDPKLQKKSWLLSWRDPGQSDIALNAEESTSQGVFALPHPTQTAFQRNQSSTVAFTQKIKRATPTTRCCPPSSKGFAGFLAASLSSGSQQAWDQSTGNMGRHHISPEMPQLAGLIGWDVVDFGEPPRLWQPRRDAGSPLQPSLGWKEKSPIPLGTPDAAAVADDDVPHGFNQFNLRSTFYRRINNVAKVLFDISVGNGICISSGNFFIIEMRGKNYLGFVAYR